MKPIVKELNNGKFALIADRAYILSKLSEETKPVHDIINNQLINEIADRVVNQIVEGLKTHMINQRPVHQKALTPPRINLTIAPSQNPEELRKQIHQMISKLAEMKRHSKEERGFTWTDAYTLLYERTGYDVKSRGEVYIRGKGTSLLNRIEIDGKLSDLLRVLRNYLYN
jgi:hypothetical protein